MSNEDSKTLDDMVDCFLKDVPQNFVFKGDSKPIGDASKEARARKMFSDKCYDLLDKCRSEENSIRKWKGKNLARLNKEEESKLVEWIDTNFDNYKAKPNP